MTTAPLGIGMIGLGLISWVHEAAYGAVGEECRIVAMCDADPEMASNRAALHDAAPIVDYRELLARGDVDLVDIAVPHDMHHEVTMAALAAGKHVVVEKPIAVTSGEAREMIETARSAGLTLAVAENTRYVSAYRAVDRLLGDGVLGEVRIVRSLIAGSEVERIRDPGTWHGKAPHGGVILDSAVHSFYLYRWLFGGVSDVVSHASRLVPEGEMEDNAVLLGCLEGGGEYRLEVSCTMEIPWTERLEVYGSDGSVVLDQLVSPVVRLYRGGSDVEGEAVQGVAYEPERWKFTSMFAEIADFVAAARDGRGPLVDPEDALHALEAVEAAYRSLAIGEPVTV